MAQFLTRALEQMDLALDQLIVNDPNYNRFTLMLVDNVVELLLHRYALDRSSENEMRRRMGLEPKYPPKLVAEALGKYFDPKVKLAAYAGFFSASAGIKDTIDFLHAFRNRVYHGGITDDAILPAISVFYFQSACDVLEQYRPLSYSCERGNAIPYRAQKYLGANPEVSLPELFGKACKRLREISGRFTINLPASLADHIGAAIDEADEQIQFLASDGPAKMTREQTIIDCQAWCFAQSEKGKAFAVKNGCHATNVLSLVEWLKVNDSWAARGDPMPKWRLRRESIRRESDPHRALSLYRSFMDQTEELRTTLSNAAIELDLFIQQETDRALGK